MDYDDPRYMKVWLRAAGIRALKTFAQAMAAGLTVGASIGELDWGYLASCALVAAAYSLLTSIAGLPEVKMLGGEVDDAE